MPQINNVSIKKKYRAWDSDILSKLKIGGTDASNNEKTVANQEQKNSDVINNKLVANQEQTDSKLAANQEQTDSKLVANQEQTSPISDSKTGSKNGFFSLTGLQRHIVVSIYELCKLARGEKTDPISIYQISTECNHSVKTVKNAINRLVKKEILFRNCFKNGRGGWTVYSIPNNIHQEILSLEKENKVVANREQTGSKLASELIANTSSSSSSKNIYINTTTTGELQKSRPNNLSNEWLNIDIEPLSNIGFTKTHLTQIASQSILTPELVQGSIYAFAFDLQENDKAKKINGDPINFFMGILRNGKPYAPSSNYESPQDKAVRLYREKMREIEQKRAEAEKEAITFAFNDWFNKLTNEQKVEFLPKILRNNMTDEKLNKSERLKKSARSYFENEIWLDKKNEILSEINTIQPEEVTTIEN